jgi:hypothetical protein
MARKPIHMRMIKVLSPKGDIEEVAIANARDMVRHSGYKYHSEEDAPKEQTPIVGEQRPIEDAVQVDDDTSGDPSPSDIDPEIDEKSEDE